MDIRQLKYFVAVAEEGNIGRAALRLHVSQPPLTRQIQQLEEKLGTALFVRTPKGVEITTAGLFFLEGARSMIALMERTVERTQRAGQGQLGRLDVGIFGSGTLDVIPKLLQHFSRLFPDVRVVLHTMNKIEQIEALRQRRIEVGFNRLVADMPDIASELVKREELLAAIREDHPLNTRTQIRLQDLAALPMIVFPSGSRPNFIDYVYQLFKNEDLHPTVTQEVGDAATGVALVAGGLGVCLVPESTTNLRIPGVVYRPIAHEPKVTVDLSCIYRRSEQSPTLRALLEIVRGVRKKELLAAQAREEQALLQAPRD
ncbi:LysR substrate-binding domain-containing protein [Hydrogenophaga laconesensis]|uniref:DNA-binding transcriptional LysR family regulator n=1 Tax=Hydrogenophaga laconesensis TaxID=1805971 RepID=A0ABU1V8Z7_9BURK|nr:LysR substrate-binding domain-containing protein [Hydrogenophaga laconesensis]MDR7093929.1 DNA-binding transcriptional LysR family regulator [Hydrogenophaga laconesensis]